MATMTSRVTWCVQVREQMQAEIEKYKQETEEAVNRTVAEMKAALEARLKEKIQLEQDKERLEALVAHLQGQVNELQAQVVYSSSSSSSSSRCSSSSCCSNRKYN